MAFGNIFPYAAIANYNAMKAFHCHRLLQTLRKVTNAERNGPQDPFKLNDPDLNIYFLYRYQFMIHVHMKVFFSKSQLSHIIS